MLLKQAFASVLYGSGVHTLACARHIYRVVRFLQRGACSSIVEHYLITKSDSSTGVWN